MRIGNGMISYKTTTKLFFQDNTIRWQYFTSKPFLILLNLFQSTKVYWLVQAFVDWDSDRNSSLKFPSYNRNVSWSFI